MSTRLSSPLILDRYSEILSSTVRRSMPSAFRTTIELLTLVDFCE